MLIKCQSSFIVLIDDVFEKLLSLMVGSFYVTMHNNPSDVVKARDMILGDHSFCENEFNLQTMTYRQRKRTVDKTSSP